MSSPEIKVTFSALSTAQTDVAATAGRIRAQLEDLKKFLAPMVSTWSGQAAEDYQVTQRKWDTSANDLAQVLAQIGTALGAAHDNYRQTEQANAARWRA
ncbi:WXG100 family type VII secretion target [Pseudonocardia sediminis]|uniref:ESAT-6-like protein n=1 Tax=Pseudonocardia sediminis TaxID=1397368 RepID=A0A4Q7V6D5_PSEST|nr:WXG100 family type VII secretion target [Pseudonocardia sediminis]RZT88343.1 WXG100 family type VII secretion target [Pseudonocardia sediminis]